MSDNQRLASSGNERKMHKSNAEGDKSVFQTITPQATTRSIPHMQAQHCAAVAYKCYRIESSLKQRVGGTGYPRRFKLPRVSPLSFHNADASTPLPSPSPSFGRLRDTLTFSMDSYGNLESIYIDEVRTWTDDEICESFYAPGETTTNPVLLAAGLQDTSRLRFLPDRAQLLDPKTRSDVVLNHIQRPEEVGSMDLPTPILRAVETRRLENVRLLLDHGANPNGVPIATQLLLARLQRRFTTRPHDNAADMDHPISADEVGTVASQTVPLTDEELRERRTKVARFWTEPHKCGVDYSTEAAQLHSIVRAGASTAEILELLLNADDGSGRCSADASFWRDIATVSSLPEEEQLTPSSLAISTPLHSAIATNNMAMLRSLLDCGFSPNARAVITGSLALSPAQYAIITGHYEAYCILTSHPCVEVGALTPVFGVHILHFAAALLSIEALEATGLPLSSAPPTSLGHTLLHVACLPYRREEIQYSPKIHESIHDTRNLHYSQFKRQSPDNVSFDSSGEKRIERCKDECDAGPRDIPDEFHKQEAMCRRIVQELGTAQIALAGVNGNTPLHYLVSGCFVNEGLVAWMRSQTEGEFAWQNAANFWGHTPQDLWDDNRFARVEPGRGGRGLPASRYWQVHGKTLRGRK